MNYDYDLKNASRKGKQPYKPQKIQPRDFSATLPPLPTNTEEREDEDNRENAVIYMI
jgi:hypothetical protein